MSNDGFATFISDDLPGFNSLNGSGFFDQVGDWNNKMDDSSNTAEDGFDEDCFDVVRSSAAKPASIHDDVYFCESADEDDEDDGDAGIDGSGMDKLATSNRDHISASQVSRSSRRRSDRSPKRGERKPRTAAAPSLRADGKRRQMRRSRTVNDGADGSSGGRPRGTTTRRIKSSDGTTRKMSNMRRQQQQQSSNCRRSENLKKKGLDLGSRLTKLEAMMMKNNEAEREEEEREQRSNMRRPASDKDLSKTDEVSVASRGVQSCAGGRRDARRRRASQQHDLLARNLQHFAKANELESRRSSTTDLPSKAAAMTAVTTTAVAAATATKSTSGNGKEEVWRARRRRSVEATSLPMPALAA